MVAWWLVVEFWICFEERAIGFVDEVDVDCVKERR